MSIKMFQVLFANTIILDLNISINKKVIFCTYNLMCMLQIGIFKIIINQKGIKSQCSFFIVSLNGPALLGMPDCERLQLLSMNYDTIESDHNSGAVLCTTLITASNSSDRVELLVFWCNKDDKDVSMLGTCIVYYFFVNQLQVNEQSNKDRSKTYINLKINMTLDEKITRK